MCSAGTVTTLCDPANISSNDPAPDSFDDDIVKSGHEVLENKERGCGFLERGKGYLRSISGSSEGVLPAWVECNPPIPFKEIGSEGSFTRGYREFDGLTFQLATEERVTQYVPHSPTENYEHIAFERMADAGLYDTANDVPPLESQRHIDRIRHCRFVGEHWGEIETAGHADLLMRAGETYYPEPEDFANEVIEMGLSKAIPVSPRNDPPTVVTGITRCWIMHPPLPVTTSSTVVRSSATLTWVNLSSQEPEDGDVPEYISEMEQSRKLRVVDIEDPEPADDDDTDDSNTKIADFFPDDDAKQHNTDTDIEVIPDNQSPWATVTDGEKEIRVNGIENATEVKQRWEELDYESAERLAHD
jgi:hypothetical protein